MDKLQNNVLDNVSFTTLLKSRRNIINFNGFGKITDKPFQKDNHLSIINKNLLVPFLFAAIGSKEKWADGSLVLRKYANICGI